MLPGSASSAPAPSGAPQPASTAEVHVDAHPRKRPPGRLPEALRRALERVTVGTFRDWFSLSCLPVITVRGLPLDAADLARVVTALAQTPLEGGGTGSGATLLGALRRYAEPTSRDTFAGTLLDHWHRAGGWRYETWPVAAVGHLGGDGCVWKLTPLLRQWPLESPRLQLGLDCLRVLGSDTALLALQGIAQIPRLSKLKQQARKLLERMARDRGLTPEQLADRSVPHCGLDARGSRLFDFGPRQLCCVLGPALEPQLRDATGKIRPELPAPRKTDDPDKAAVARAEWRLLRKTLAEVVAVQSVRLEESLGRGCWTAHHFQRRVVQHPLMGNLLRALVLAAYDAAGRVLATFRLTEDRSFTDENDEQVRLPAGSRIGVAHPAQLDDDLRSAWNRLLEDYKIIPLFEQLGREVHRPDPADLDRSELSCCRGLRLAAQVLWGILESHHWSLDTSVRLRGFSHHSRHFPSARVTFFIRYTTSTHSDLRTIDALYCIHAQARNPARLRDLDPASLSEVLRVAYAIASKAG